MYIYIHYNIIYTLITVASDNAVHQYKDKETKVFLSVLTFEAKKQT